MKKIINKKVYDTKTAERIGSWDNGCYGDLSYCSEDLYRKKTGEFFLHGDGGPMSKYAKSIGDNNWAGGEIIIPLSFDKAKEWAEKHLPAEKYEEIFGEIVEDETKQVVTLSLTASNYKRAKRAADIAGISVSALIDDLIGQL